MADSSGGKDRPRGFAIFIELLQQWWQHRVSFLISLAITLTALGLYVVTYIGVLRRSLLVVPFERSGKLAEAELLTHK